MYISVGSDEVVIDKRSLVEGAAVSVYGLYPKPGLQNVGLDSS